MRVEWTFGELVPDLIEIRIPGDTVTPPTLVASIPINKATKQPKAYDFVVPAPTFLTLVVSPRIVKNGQLTDQMSDVSGQVQYWETFSIQLPSLVVAPSAEQPSPAANTPPTITNVELTPGRFIVHWVSPPSDHFNVRIVPSVVPSQGQVELKGRHRSWTQDGVISGRSYRFSIQRCTKGVFKSNCSAWVGIDIKVPVPPPPLIHPIYAVTNDGTLLWYRHEGQSDGTARWAANQGINVGNGWQRFESVFSGGDGVIYAIERMQGSLQGGNLLWWRHEGRDDGTLRWAANSGNIVGNGWSRFKSGFKHVFSGGKGVIYAVRGNGELLWYRHEGYENGAFRWTSNEPRSVGGGAQIKLDLYRATIHPNRVFAGPGGRIYAIMDNGDLEWFRHDGYETGTDKWLSEIGRKVGNEWRMKDVFAVGDDGVIYARAQNDDLLWYRHDGWIDGSFTWAANSGSRVSNRWNFDKVFGR